MKRPRAINKSQFQVRRWIVSIGFIIDKKKKNSRIFLLRNAT